MKELIYFAHTINIFGSILEAEMLLQIGKFFNSMEIENPNQPHHQEGYRTWKERFKDDPQKSGMTYYYECVLPDCSACVCQIYFDGKWGAGVAHEAAFFIKKNQPVWLIEPGVRDIRLLTPEEKTLIANNDTSLVLSIEETRARIKEGGLPDGKPIPYERAHLIKL